MPRSALLDVSKTVTRARPTSLLQRDFLSYHRVALGLNSVDDTAYSSDALPAANLSRRLFGRMSGQFCSM